MPNTVLSPELAEALSHLRVSMPAEENHIADRMEAICGMHVRTFRDAAFESRFRKMKRSLVAHFTGHTKQHRMIIVTGESHSGKTDLINRCLDADPGLAPYPTNDGYAAVPVLRMDSPSPCNMVNMAVEGLETLGYPVKGNIREKEAWPLFRNQLKRHRVLIIFIDEAQHAVNSTTNRADLQRLRDTFKHVTQMKDWPVRLILAGVTPLERLREDKQIRTRSIPMHLGDITAAHARHVRHWMQKVVEEHAGMRLDDFVGGDFPLRIIHGCGGCFGSIIQLSRMAVEDALTVGKEIVDLSSFANAYATMTGCSKQENILTVPGWRSIKGASARATEAKEQPEDAPTPAAPSRATALKAHRGGER
ncbi:ATP-binding protein [Rhizobium sp. 22-785-1]